MEQMFWLTIKWTKFHQILTPSAPRMDILEILYDTYPLSRDQVWTLYWPPPLSCSHGYWMTPKVAKKFWNCQILINCSKNHKLEIEIVIAFNPTSVQLLPFETFCGKGATLYSTFGLCLCWKSNSSWLYRRLSWKLGS